MNGFAFLLLIKTIVYAYIYYEAYGHLCVVVEMSVLITTTSLPAYVYIISVFSLQTLGSLEELEGIGL